MRCHIIEIATTSHIGLKAPCQGLPILGDELYGGQAAKRLYLHAARLAFKLNGKNYDVSSAMNELPRTRSGS
jgi:tRNA pseudouridine32 synthase/23S rRNA pseudouridine746 synthase